MKMKMFSGTVKTARNTGNRTNAQLAVYKTKTGGYITKRKSGKTSEKDPIARRMNAFLRKNADSAAHITTIYAAKSRVMRSTQNVTAVKLSNNMKGWITESGAFISQEFFKTQVLRGIDNTTVARSAGVSLEEIWDSLSAKQKAEVVDAFAGYDWDAYFEEWYPKEGAPANFDKQYVQYRDILNRFGSALGQVM